MIIADESIVRDFNFKFSLHYSYSLMEACHQIGLSVFCGEIGPGYVRLAQRLEM